MNSYLNILNFLNFKFEFPGKNLNQSEKRIYGEYYITIANQLLLRNRKQNIQPFFGFMQKLIYLKREISLTRFSLLNMS